MKRLFVVFGCFGLLTITLFLQSCGHNLGLVSLGTGFRLGNGEYGFAYGDGLFGTFVTKDGARFKAEIDSTTGFSYDPSTNTYKGIRSIEYSLPPQITGYAVDFARKNPEVAKAYYEALIKFYEIKGESAVEKSTLISDEKSKDANANISDVLKKALEKAKDIVANKGDADGGSTAPDINGDGNYQDLWKDDSISCQMAIATQLLKYADNNTMFKGTEITLLHSLQTFLARLAQLSVKGKTTTQMRVKYAIIEENKLADLLYVVIRPDGDQFDTNCPECVIIEE